jgi:hypothetical protein
VDGDQAWDRVNDQLYVWSGTAWNKVSPLFDWQAVAGSPVALATATQSDGTPLVEGDQAWNSVGDQLYVWNGTSWILAGQKKVVVTAVSLTANAGEYIVVTAATRTITLPATPTVGSEVTVVVAGTFTDTVVARNGSNIMSLAEDITLDKQYAAMVFTYVDATNGWRLN